MLRNILTLLLALVIEYMYGQGKEHYAVVDAVYLLDDVEAQPILAWKELQETTSVVWPVEGMGATENDHARR